MRAPSGSRLELALLALPAAPIMGLAAPLAIFLPPYYASHLGLPLALVSALFVSVRVFDLVIDPAIGVAQDRTVSRLGRRKLWLAFGAPAFMAAIWAAFIAMPAGASAFLASAAVALVYLTYATLLLAHTAWAGEMRDDYHGRTAALGALQIAGLIGQILLLGLAAFLVQSGAGNDADAVRALGWTLVIAAPICIGICLAFVREAPPRPQEPLRLRAALTAILENAPLRRVLLPDLLTGVGAGVQSGLFVFYFQHVLGFWRESQTLLFIYFLAGLVGAPLWVFIARAIGKHRALIAACIFLSLVTLALPFVPRGAFWIAAPLMVIGGLPTAASAILLRAMMADVVDEDEVKTGAKRTSLFFALLLTTNKVGLVAGPLTYVFLGAAHFDPTAHAANSGAALATLSALFIGAPLLLNLIAAATLRNYPLDATRQAALRGAIASRAS